jgi:23S rRNA pseudouridine1911/1915/1917 synthase
MTDSIAHQRAVVEKNASGMRLDLFLTQHFDQQLDRYGVSRSRMQRLIEDGLITVNGAPAKSSTRLKPSDLVELSSFAPAPTNLAAEDVPLNVIYEDDDCVIINKAPGMTVHPAAGRLNGTLVNALLHHCPELKRVGAEGRPGIVHRLDKDTSGVMVVAKNHRSLQNLAGQFKDRTVQKEYLALVWGKFEKNSGIIDRPIGRHRSQRHRMSSRFVYSRTREAVTEWKVEKSLELTAAARSTSSVTLLRLRPKTGRTHQIRVHLADLGYPLVGDKLYGSRSRNDSRTSTAFSLLGNFPRQALHAESLEFNHPKTGFRIKFKADLYEDIDHLIKELEKQRVG